MFPDIYKLFVTLHIPQGQVLLVIKTFWISGKITQPFAIADNYLEYLHRKLKQEKINCIPVDHKEEEFNFFSECK